MPIDKVTIGPRFRQDLGDITALAASIAQIGLLQPIIVTTDYALVVGQRRLAAYQHLKRDTIEARVVDLADPLQAELDENEQRKAFTPSERVAIGRALADQARAEAKKRQAQAGGKGNAKQRNGSGTVPEPFGDARDHIAGKVGWSAHTYERAEAVVKAAEEEPELQELVEAMDRTGNVTRAYNQLPPYARAHPADDTIPRARKPPRPMTVGAMQLKLDAVVLDIIAPRLYQLADHEVEHLYKLLDFYRELIAQERAGTFAEGATPAPAEEPAPQPQGLWCLWCGGQFSTAEDELRHRAQCGGYTPAPEASSTKRRQGSTR